MSRSRRSVSVFVALLVVSLGLASCDGGSTGPQTSVASVAISGAPSENVLLVGATAQLAAVARDAGGATLERRVTWTSSDPTIATVSSNGLVTALTSGVVGITATSGGESAVLGIAVRVAVAVPPVGAPAPVTTTFLGNTLSLTIAPGAAAAPSLTVGRALLITNDTRLLTATAFAIGPTATTFTTPVTAEVTVNLVAVPTAKRAGLRLFRVTETGDLEGVTGGSVDLVRGVVVAPLVRAGTYVVLVPADVALLTDAEGTGRRVPVGTAVPGIGVIARDAAGNPVAGANIQFSVVGGTGSIVGSATAFTDIDGRADLPGEWIVGQSTGTYLLRAQVVGTALTVQYSATAFAPAVAVRIASAPTEGLSGVILTGAIPVELVDANGNRAEETMPVTLSLIGGSGTLAGTTVETAVNGGAIFQGQRIDGPGTYRFVVSAAGLTPDTSDAVVITQQVAWMEMLTQPAGAASGVPFTTQPVVELLDHARIRVTGGTPEVTASVLGSLELLGTRTVTAVNGIATFSDLAVEGVGALSLNFVTNGPVNVISSEFTVAPAPPGVRLLLGPALVRTATPNQLFAPPLNVDLSNRGGADVRALDVTLTWDPARFEYFDFATGPWNDSTQAAAIITVDVSQAAAGIVRFSGSTTEATVASFRLGLVILRTLGTTSMIESTIGATVNAATNAAGQPVPVRVLPLTVTVQP